MNYSYKSVEGKLTPTTQPGGDHSARIGQTAPAAGERALSEERLREIVRNSAVSAYGWFTGREIPRARLGDGYSQFGSVASEPAVMGEARRAQSDHEILGAFLIAGVTEVVTPRRLAPHLLMRQAKPTTYKPGEPITAIDYEVTTAGNDSRAVMMLRQTDPEKYNALRYEYAANSAFERPRDTAGVPSTNIFIMTLFLPESDAAELLAAVETDPQIMRDSVDIAMRQEIEAGTTWDVDGARIPFERWRELNGGVSRMALRDDPRKGPTQSTILEF